jgi:hypothetical protein
MKIPDVMEEGRIYSGTQFQRCQSITVERIWWGREIHILAARSRAGNQEEDRASCCLQDIPSVTYFFQSGSTSQ